MNKSFIKFLRFFISFFGVIFLFKIFFENYEYFLLVFNKGYILVLPLLLAAIIHHNIVSVRSFLLFRYFTKYKENFFKWSKLFFESISLNLIFSHSGSLYRAGLLKLSGVKYREFLGFFYLVFISYLCLNLFFILFEFIFLSKIKTLSLLLALLSVIILIILFFYFPIILTKMIDKLNLKKFNIFKYIIDKLNLVIEFVKNNLNKKVILIIFSTVLLNHIFELLIFYLSYSIIHPKLDIGLFILFFGVSFLLDRTPLINSYPGVSELIFATISVPFGYNFTDGVLLKFIIRVIGILSIIFNIIFFNIFALVVNLKRKT